MSNYGDKRFQTPPVDPCVPPVRSRQTLSGPQICFIQIANNGPNGQADVPLVPAFPCNSFFIVSRKGGTETTTVFFHLTQLYKSYSTPNVATAATGQEQWISMTSAPATGPNYLTVIRFKEKILKAFLDIGFEGGAGLLTIACVADDDISISGGLYT